MRPARAAEWFCLFEVLLQARHVRSTMGVLSVDQLSWAVVVIRAVDGWFAGSPSSFVSVVLSLFKYDYYLPGTDCVHSSLKVCPSRFRVCRNAR